MKIKLPSIPVKATWSRWTETLAQRLPRINLAPLTARWASATQPLTSGLQRLVARFRPPPLLLRFLWPLLSIGVLVVLVILARAYLAKPAAAMPGEVARFNLVAGQQVILWYSMSDTAGSALVSFIDEFNAHNEWGITVVPQDQGTYSRLRERLDQALAHRATPDLVALRPYHAAAYASDGYAVTLDDYVNHPQRKVALGDWDDFIPAVLTGQRSPQLDNQLVSFPIGPDAMLLVYNLDWLRSLGYQGPPLTWGTFKEVCKQAVADTNGDGANDTFGYAFVADAPTFSGLVLSREGQVLSPDGRRVLFNTLEGEKALRILRDTFGSDCAYTVPGRDWDRADFTGAKTLFNIVPSSALPAYEADIERTSVFRWGATPLPHNSPDPITSLDGQGWTILKTTPDRQLAAWFFVRWFAEPDQTQRWTLANYTLPLRRSTVEVLLETPDLDPYLKQVLELAEYGQSEPPVPQWEAVRKIVVDAMRDVIGGMDPADALKQAEADANAALGGVQP